MVELLGGVVVLLLCTTIYSGSKCKGLKRDLDLHKQLSLDNEKSNIKEINALKKEISSLYKTIDEYTSEKANLVCEAEVCEKALKKSKTKK